MSKKRTKKTPKARKPRTVGMEWTATFTPAPGKTLDEVFAEEDFKSECRLDEKGRKLVEEMERPAKEKLQNFQSIPASPWLDAVVEEGIEHGDPVGLRRAENLPKGPKSSFCWEGAWTVGPGVLLRRFQVLTEPADGGSYGTCAGYDVQAAGFTGNLVELYRTCIRVSEAVQGDFANIVERINTVPPQFRWFEVGNVVVEVKRVH